MNRILLFLFSSAFAIQLHGQTYPFDQVTIASPNAASLGKYADFPVSYHTGVPNIDIPIYTVEHGSLKLPISLSYHASGLKVEETSSWVGRGWSLNAGGVITRSVKGAPDDCGLNFAATTRGHFTHYGYTSYLHENGPNCIPNCPTPSSPDSRYPDDMGIMSTGKDGEPDLYFFNFGQYQGKFYFHDDRSVVMVPQGDLKIEPLLAASMPTFIYMTGFKITTPDGVQYFFGKNQDADGNPDAHDLTYNINTHTTSITMQGVVSSWYLNKIVSADGLFSIKLTYESDQFSTYSLAKWPIMNVKTPEFGSAYGNYEYDLAKEHINGVRLKEITWPNGKLSFKESTSAREDLSDYLSMTMTDVANTSSGALDVIEIDNLAGYCKKFKFYTSYFRDLTSPMNGTYPISSINSDKHSLRLDSLQEMTCDNANKLPLYKFEYNPGKVSRKISFGQDHWGFNNGVTSNTTLIPTYWINNENYDGADREPDETAMKGGALEKITYPTGGFTQFDYEAHDTRGTIIAKSWSNLTSVSGGFGSSPVNVLSVPFNVTTGTVRLKLTNNPGGSVAAVELINSSNVTVLNMSTAIGTTMTQIHPVPNGTYTLKLTKETAGGNNGCGAEICQLITTSTLSNITVGGLRIKTITTNDGITSNNIIKTFKYTFSEFMSSGYLFSRPVYVSLIRNDILKDVGYEQGPLISVYGCVSPDNSPTQPYFKSGASITPLATTKGNHIGYIQVTVTETGNGFSIYKYYQPNVWQIITGDVVTRNLDNRTCALSAPNFPFAPVPFELRVGDLSYEGHFKEGGQPLKETDYNPAYELDTMTTLGYIVTFADIAEALKIWGTEYELRSGRKVSLATFTTEIDPATGNTITQTNGEIYESKFHNKPTRNYLVASNGNFLYTLTKYALDYRVAACDNINSGYASYLNAYNTVWSTYMTALTCTTTANCRWTAYQQYRWDRKLARANYINYRKVNFTNPDSEFKQKHDIAKTNALTEFKPILQLQDNNNNAIIEVTKLDAGSSLIDAMFIRYDFSTNPTTSVYPNKVQKIPMSTAITNFTPSNSNGTTTVTKDSRYQDENIYKFYQGNIVEITKKNGIINSFIYGLNNSVPIAKAINVNHTTLLAAYNASAGNLTTMRNQASLSGALVSTYTYSPILGLTSEQNENKRNIFYEYDFFGRLKHLKDHNTNVLKVIDYRFQVPTNL